MAKFVITDYTESMFEHEVVNRLIDSLNIKAMGYVIRNSVNKNGKRQGSSCGAYDIDEVRYKFQRYLKNARRKNTHNYEITKIILQRIGDVTE